MKKTMRLIVVRFSLLLLACLITVPADAMTLSPGIHGVADTLTVGDEPFARSVYERRIEKRMKRWQRILPSHYKVQFAGSIGVVSLGCGWTYGKRDRWETDLMLGVLPKFESDEGKAVFTLRQSYIPWRVRLGHSHFVYKPFTVGLFFSSILNDEFWTGEPDRYPSGYYGFSTRLRINLCMGQRFTYYVPEHKRLYARGISFYYEFSACDTDFCTFFGDRCIKFKDIVSLALGVKLHI